MFFFSSRRRHTRWPRDWSSDVCSSDLELRPGHHVGLEFNSDSEVEKIIVNNKSKHPNARVIEVERVDLNHDLIIEGYELDKMDEKLSFQVHEKALFVMDERETQIAPYDRQFASKTVGQRAMQLFAGPMMNILLAALLFMLLGVMQGVPEDRAIIGSTEPGSPAAEAGIMEGDEIVEVDGTPIDEWEAFTIMIAEHPNEELQLKIKRDEEIIPMAVTPAEIEVEGETIGQLGVRLAFEKSVSKSLLYGFEQTYEITKLIIVNLVMLVTGQYSIDMLGGPVMIYDVTDQAVSLGIETFIMWTAKIGRASCRERK